MIKNVLEEFARANECVFENREATTGSSDIGQCARKVFWAKKGGPRDPKYVDGWGARARGTMFENTFWAPAMRARYGADLLYAGKQQKTLVLGLLSATPDGLLVRQPKSALKEFGITDIGRAREIVVEAKTIDPRARLDEARAAHAFQVQVQLGLFHELTPHQPEYAVISYIDASFWDECTEFVIARDPRIFIHAKRRAEMIMSAKSASDMKPEGWISGGDECRHCPFTQACGIDRTQLPYSNDGTADPTFLTEIIKLARAAKRHEANADASYELMREVQNTIREKLRQKQLICIKTDTLRITWSSVKGRPSFDMKGVRAAAEAAGIDISRFETVGDPSDRLVVQLLDKSS